MPDTHVHPAPLPSPAHAIRPKLWVADGRQRVGKTVLLNTAVQHFRTLGSQVAVWNADQQNQSHSLSMFHPDALVPEARTLQENQAWVEARLADQAKRQYHAVLDVGGGNTGFSALVQEMPILEALGDQGIDVVGLFCVGPEQADLDQLARQVDSKAFLPERSAIVLNAGLVARGFNVEQAFQRVLESAACRSALKRGARIVEFPDLPCMAQVTDRGISFADAAANIVKPGQGELIMWDALRVKEWWTKKVPAFFGSLPPDWLPMPLPGMAPATGDGR